MWERFPEELLLEPLLVQGGAFRTIYQFGSEGMKFRYFVILNREPATSTRLLLVTLTSNIRGRRAVRNPDVLVQISPVEFPELEKESIIDCESTISMQMMDLVAKVESGRIKPIGRVPETLLERLLAAVGNTRTMTPADKSLILASIES